MGYGKVIFANDTSEFERGAMMRRYGAQVIKRHTECARKATDNQRKRRNGPNYNMGVNVLGNATPDA